jgi:hypothetical protein
VKTFSLNFFCKWKILKKALLGMWKFACNRLGKTKRQATV